MAKETVTLLTDDIDGSEAAESVTFGFRGTGYEIDLSAKNVAALEKTFAKWIEFARPPAADAATDLATTRPARPRPATRSTGDDPSTIREWARSNGYEVSARGRIPASLQEAFKAAHS